MRKYKLKEIRDIVEGKLVGNPDIQVDSVSKDSRLLPSGSLFFAIRGERFDSHDFLADVFDKGIPAIVEREPDKKDSSANYIIVENTVRALQNLAAHYIAELSPGRIAVTGSTGKTGTKDMLLHILKTKFKAHGNKMNLNNDIGLPMSILEMDEDTEIAVLEMGMDKAGEIERLADIMKPQLGVITNIGLSHIMNFENQKGILDAKMEITKFFDEEKKLIVYNDDDFLKTVTSDKYEIVRVGTTGKSDFIISGIEDGGDGSLDFFIEHEHEMQKFHLPIPGRHNAANASLAVAASFEYGISLEESARALESLQISGKRLSLKTSKGIKIIDDTYNASPDSMKAALDVLCNQRGIRKVAVLGDMFELGENERQYHREIGLYAEECPPDLLVTVGNLSQEISKAFSSANDGRKALHFEDKEKALIYLKENIKMGDIVLVKGSRGMAMEKIVEDLLK